MAKREDGCCDEAAWEQLIAGARAAAEHSPILGRLLFGRAWTPPMPEDDEDGSSACPCCNGTGRMARDPGDE